MRTLKPRARRVRLLAAAMVASLAAAAIAIADPGPATVGQVSATFYANTLTSSHSTTCTGANNDAFQITHATFTGTAASSDARLAGPATVDVVSVYDQTKNLGWLSGDLRIASTTATPPSGPFHGHLSAVNVNGTAQGLVTGGLGGGVRLLGSFTGSFSATGGFGSSATPVSIGAGTGTNTALVASGGCTEPDTHPGQGDHHGKVHVDIKVHVSHQHVPKHH